MRPRRGRQRRCGRQHRLSGRNHRLPRHRHLLSHQVGHRPAHPGIGHGGWQARVWRPGQLRLSRPRPDHHGFATRGRLRRARPVSQPDACGRGSVLTPLGRLGEPADMVDAVAFLARCCPLHHRSRPPVDGGMGCEYGATSPWSPMARPPHRPPGLRVPARVQCSVHGRRTRQGPGAAGPRHRSRARDRGA